MHEGPVVAPCRCQEALRTVAGYQSYKVVTERTSFPLSLTDVLAYMTTEKVGLVSYWDLLLLERFMIHTDRRALGRSWRSGSQRVGDG